MHVPRLSAAYAALSLSAFAVLGLASTASAENGCPTGYHYNPQQVCVPNGTGNGGNNNGQGNGGIDQGTGTDKKVGSSGQGKISGHGAQANSPVTATAPKPAASSSSLRQADGAQFLLRAASSAVIGSTTANQTGNWSLQYQLPAGTPAGVTSIRIAYIDAATGLPSTLLFPVNVTSRITGKAAGTGSAGTDNTPVSVGGVQLPRTGTEIALVSLVGIALVGTGAASLAAGRRRRQLPIA